MLGSAPGEEGKGSPVHGTGTGVSSSLSPPPCRPSPLGSEAPVWVLLAAPPEPGHSSAPSVSLQVMKWRPTGWLADCGWEDRMWWEKARPL